MKKKIILIGAALSLTIFSACSSDDHSSTSPEDDTLSSSSSLTLDDIDKILGSSSSKGKDASSSSVKVDVSRDNVAIMDPMLFMENVRAEFMENLLEYINYDLPKVTIVFTSKIEEAEEFEDENDNMTK